MISKYKFYLIHSILIIALVVIGAHNTLYASEINPCGYLKINKNRIRTFSYKPGTTEQEIHNYAKGLMHTQGRMTAAYFYPKGSLIPVDGITLAKNIFRANYVLYNLPGLSCWKYAFMRYLNGNIEFVNCEKNPDNWLCRQKNKK